MKFSTLRGALLGLGLTAVSALTLAACDGAYDVGNGRSLQPIPQKTLAAMEALGSTASSPIIFRAYKKEAELEIWKQKSDGQYALLKTYPMCRWSGQLGPKTREGDRQVPEGFYTITPGQMNPNSNYYLSFNVGYPNAYDRAYDRAGGKIMVHGACSSAGCFSMTDEQIGEIYAIAREAFNAGQREIQFQSYPFRMNTENLAKHRLDPNIAFWKELKNGYDHFEVTKTEVPVLVCNRHYVFGAKAEGDYSARGACPKMIRDEETETQVAAKASKDETQVAALVAKGEKAVKLVYDDGGQHPSFAGRFETSRPDALAQGPREIVLEPSAKPLPAAVEVAALSKARKGAKPAPVAAPSAPAETVVAGQAPEGGLVEGGKSLMKSLFKTADAPPAVKAMEPQEPAAPAEAPLPPRRGAKPLKMAALPEKDAAK